MRDILISASILTHEIKFVNTSFEFYQKIMGKILLFQFCPKKQKPDITNPRKVEEEC